jgi:hypothetical protein
VALLLLASDSSPQPDPPLASWDGAGLTAGTLTTSSVGTGDTAFTSIAGGAGITVESSGATPPRVAMAAATANIYCGWGSTVLGTISEYTATALFELASIGSASWAIITGSVGATVQWRVELGGTAASPPGQLRLRNATAQVAASSQGLVAGVLYRLRVSVTAGVATVSVTNAATGAAVAGPISATITGTSIDNVRFGNFTTSTTGPVMYWDAMRVGATIPVTASRATTWSVSQQLNQVVTSRSTSWDSLARASKYRTLSWGVTAQVAAERTTTWSVLLPPVIAARETSWASLQRVSKWRTVTWQVFSGSSVATSIDTSWASLQRVSKWRTTSWSSLAPVTSSRSTSWQVIGRVTRTWETYWGVDPGPTETQPVSTSAATSWQVQVNPLIPPLPVVPRRVASGFLVVVRNANLQRVGAVAVTSLTFTPRYNDVGDWSLTCSADAPTAEALYAPGAGVLIYRSEEMGIPLMTGPVRSRQRKLTDRGYELVISGPDDNVWIADRLAYQMPDRLATSQGNPSTGSKSHDRRTGPAEVVIKGYVDANVGQAAMTDRRKLTVAAVAATPRGSNVSGVARMTPLLDLISGLAATGGLGWRVQQSGTTLAFDVYEPADRRGTARFSTLLGNLESFQLDESAPTTSCVVAGGRGELTSRVFRAQVDSEALTAWPGTRVERFIDQRQAEDNAGGDAEIDQAIAEELVNGGPTTALAITTRDTNQLQFGRDYYIGDRVTVEPREGQKITDILREITITWTASDGQKAISRVGSATTTGTPRLLRLVRKLTAKQNGTSTVS